MLAYHGDSFFGLRDGTFKARCSTAPRSGRRVKGLGSDGNLSEDASTLRFATYGTTALGSSLELQHRPFWPASWDRCSRTITAGRPPTPPDAGLYRELRLGLQTELPVRGSDPNGYKALEAVDGGYLADLAPTFKAEDIGQLPQPPPSCACLPPMNWDRI